MKRSCDYVTRDQDLVVVLQLRAQQFVSGGIMTSTYRRSCSARDQPRSPNTWLRLSRMAKRLRHLVPVLAGRAKCELGLGIFFLRKNESFLYLYFEAPQIFFLFLVQKPVRYHRFLFDVPGFSTF
jgi:hypothetical protein